MDMLTPFSRPIFSISLATALESCATTSPFHRLQSGKRFRNNLSFCRCVCSQFTVLVLSHKVRRSLSPSFLQGFAGLTPPFYFFSHFRHVSGYARSYGKTVFTLISPYPSAKGLNLFLLRFLGHLSFLSLLKRFAVLLHVKGLKDPKGLIFANWDT